MKSLKGKELRLYWTICKQVVPFLVFVVFVLPIALLARRKTAPWIISGHKGRLFEDNSKALFQYIADETDQPIIWISSSPALTRRLQSEGYTVLAKHSFAARFRIFSSPILIYSHGEDDLDNFLCLLRWVMGKRIFLSHTLAYLKDRHHRRWLRRLDYDFLLSASEHQKTIQKGMYKTPRGKLIVAGGAHLDFFFAAKASTPAPSIVYFPTGRRTSEEVEHLDAVIFELTNSAPLHEWLEKTGTKFVVARHVNNPQTLEKEASDRIVFISPEELADHVIGAQMLISDYSGVLADFLAFDRPAVFFPFDLDLNLRRKEVFLDYDERRYGPRCNTPADLVSFIVEEKWRQSEAEYCEKRQALRAMCFDFEEPVYSARGYEFLRSLAGGK